MVSNVLVEEGTRVLVLVFVRPDDDDQFGVAVVVVVVVVVVVEVVDDAVDDGQRVRRPLRCTNDVSGLGASPPPAVSFPPHFHCAGGVVVCS